MKEKIAQGLTHQRATTQVYKEMGYKGAKEERSLLNQYFLTFRTETDKVRDEIREERAIENFEDALRSLPPHAPKEEIVRWIEAHPAMFRKAQKPNKDVFVTTEDILFPPHGPAPSQSAVTALQHWLNNHAEFFKTVYASQKKTSDSPSSATTDAVRDAGIEDVARLLDSLE